MKRYISDQSRGLTLVEILIRLVMLTMIAKTTMCARMDPMMEILAKLLGVI